MTTPTITRTDVNSAFHAERFEQVANIKDLLSDEGRARYIAEQTERLEARVVAGELVNLGNGRYQSTQGWDRGEIWTVRDVDGRSLVIPEHGLDIDPKTGRARLFTAAEPWHGLGQHIPGGLTDIDEIITVGQLDVPAVSVPVPDYTVPGLGGTFKAPGQFIVANGNTGEFWGVVGKIHDNVPVKVSFEFMVNILAGSEAEAAGHGKVVFESAGMMRGGRDVFISCRMPGGVTVDAAGAADYTEIFLVVQDTRDGSGSYKAMVTPWRPICGNTNRFALRDALAVLKLRHTRNLADNIAKARATLGLTTSYAEAFKAEAETLIRTETSIDDFRAVMSDLFAENAGKSASGRVWAGRMKDDETARTANANARREDALEEAFAVETGRVGRNLYAAEQALTNYLDWTMVRKGTDPAARWQNRITANLAGEDDALKTRGHARLLELATA